MKVGVNEEAMVPFLLAGGDPAWTPRQWQPLVRATLATLFPPQYKRHWAHGKSNWARKARKDLSGLRFPNGPSILCADGERWLVQCAVCDHAWPITRNRAQRRMRPIRCPRCMEL